MRIAVCLSGQLRGWKIGWNNQKWFWSTANRDDVQVDYFAHTWSYSTDRVGVTKPYSKRDVTVEEFREFASLFGTKKALLDPTPNKKFYSSDHWSGLFYSLIKSLMLKREYEIKNNFTYDVVVKSRADVVFNPETFFNFPNKLPDGILHTTHGGNMEMEFNMQNFNDCVFLGNSYTMDLLINLMHYRQYKMRKPEENVHTLGPGVLMHEFFRDYGITPIFNDLGWSEVLLKLGCPEDLNLFEEKDFIKMEKYFREWYTK